MRNWMPMLAALLMFASLTAHALARGADEPQVLQSTADRTVVQLPNRMILVVQEMSAAPVVSVQAWVKTGSIYEQEHIGAGLSHFLEHLLAGGTTTNRTEQQSIEELGRMGAQFNAVTSLTNVGYYIDTTSEHAAGAVDLISDWMQNATIPQREYERERTVIHREFDMGQGESGRIFWKLMQQARYDEHPAKHPAIGYREDFDTITRDQIYDFYKRMYVPNNMVFVVVGDVDRQQVIAQLTELWKDVPARDLPKVEFPVETEDDVQRKTVAGRAVIANPRLRLAWPTVRLTEEHDYALDLLASVLGGGESSRLVQQVRDQKRLVNTIGAYHMSQHWGKGTFVIDCEVSLHGLGEDGQPVQKTPEQALKDIQQAILREIQAISTQGVHADELARAKRQTLSAVVFSAQSAHDRANRLVMDILATGDPDYLDRYVKKIESISQHELQAAAKQFLQDERMIEVQLLPVEPGQAPEDLKREKTQDRSDTAYETVQLDNRALLEKIQAARFDQSSAADELIITDMEKIVLPNGLRLLISRNTAVPGVAMQMYSLGGLLSDEPGKEGVAHAVSVMQMRGTKKYSAQQLAREIEDLGASLVTNCGYNASYISATCLKDDWKVVLDLFSQVALEPVFPDEEWQRIQPRLRAAIARQKDGWASEVQMQLREVYYGRHPWATTPLGRDEIVAQLSAADLKTFYQDRLGASQSVLAIVGDIDPQEVRQHVEQVFKTMPVEPKIPFKAPDAVNPVAQVIQQQSDKPLAAVQVGFGPIVNRAHPDYATLRVLSSVLSSFPAGWLEEQLRGEGEGLVYAVAAFPVTGLVPGHFTLLFNTAADKVPIALTKAVSTIDRARTELVDERDLARAQAAVLAQEAIYKQTNSERAQAAALDELYGLGLNEDERLRQALKAVTPQSLRAAARTYLRNPIVVVLSNQPIPAQELENAANGNKSE